MDEIEDDVVNRIRMRCMKRSCRYYII